MNYIDIHRRTWAHLQNRRAQLPHALLIHGQSGLGKFELAQAFAKSLLCESPTTDKQACHQCLPCNWFEQGNHPDFRMLQPDALGEAGEGEENRKKASQQITIDQVRGLDDFLTIGTHRAGLRIILINPAESMNRNTANALLKSLEEPAPSTLFLLISNEPLRLLPTIRSRCQQIPVPLPSASVSETALNQLGITQIPRWLALAGGAPKLALQLAQSENGNWLDQMIQLVREGQSMDPLNAAAAIDKLIKDSKDKLGLKHVVDGLQKWLIDLVFAQHQLPVRYFLPQQDTIAKLADMIPPIRLQHAYRTLVSRRRDSEQPMNTRLFLETLFLDYRALFAPPTTP